MRSLTQLAVLMLAVLVSAACSQPAGGPKKHEMKTHSSTAPKAKVTVVHYGAPW